MSSASIPAPRSTPPSTRFSFFWPLLVFFFGYAVLTVYQVMALEDQLDENTRQIDKMDSEVKAAEHDKATFYLLARDVLNLAPTDPAADKVAREFDLRTLKAKFPGLFNTVQANPQDNSLPTTTNAAPVTPVPPATNSTVTPAKP